MDDLDDLVKRLEEAAHEHRTWVDGWGFNSSTVLALAFSAIASLASANVFADVPKWVAPVTAAVAGFLVAMERALGLGARWRFAVEMKNAYRSIIDMIIFYRLVPEEESPKWRNEIWTRLFAIRSREGNIPGAGSSAGS